MTSSICFADAIPSLKVKISNNPSFLARSWFAVCAFARATFVQLAMYTVLVCEIQKSAQCHIDRVKCISYNVPQKFTTTICFIQKESLGGRIHLKIKTTKTSCFDVLGVHICMLTGKNLSYSCCDLISYI